MHVGGDRSALMFLLFSLSSSLPPPSFSTPLFFSPSLPPSPPSQLFFPNSLLYFFSFPLSPTVFSSLPPSRCCSLLSFLYHCSFISFPSSLSRLSLPPCLYVITIFIPPYLLVTTVFLFSDFFVFCFMASHR